jgi:hypothetical protein
LGTGAVGPNPILDVLLIRRLRIEHLQHGQQYQFIAGSGLAVDAFKST